MSKIKKLITILFIFSILLTLSGCIQLGGGNEELDIVWKDYSNDYYGIKYPGEWFAKEDFSSPYMRAMLSAKEFTNNMSSYTDWDQGLEISYALKQIFSSKEEFYNHYENMVKDAPTEVTVKSHGRTMINNDPAYKLVYTVEAIPDSLVDETTNFIAVFIYREGKKCDLSYFAKPTLYNEALANKMIDSIQFFK